MKDYGGEGRLEEGIERSGFRVRVRVRIKDSGG